MCCVLGGQNWKAEDIPAKLRNNFSTRIHLKAMSKVQSRVMLEDSAAADIKDQGRAYVVLPGRELCEMQTPYINKSILAQALAVNGGGGAAAQMPEAVVIAPPEPDKKETVILEVFDSGETVVSRIAAQALGSKGGPQSKKVRETIRAYRDVEL